MEAQASPGRPDGSWNVLDLLAPPAAVIHQGEVAPLGRTAVVCRPTMGAVVLGSTQSATDFDAARCRAAHLEILRRRSGGGAVLVRPGAQVWVDLFLPRQDPLFREDVVESFTFVGELWLAALGNVLESRPPAGRLEIVSPAKRAQNRWSRTLCFGALGAGEVTLDGRKVVGIAQRRARAGAWFHSMALLKYAPSELAGLLADESARDEARAWLEKSATALPGGHLLTDSLTGAVLAQLT